MYVSQVDVDVDVDLNYIYNVRKLQEKNLTFCRTDQNI